MEDYSLINLILYTFNKVNIDNSFNLEHIDLRLDFENDIFVLDEQIPDLEIELSSLFFELLCEIRFKKEKWIKISSEQKNNDYKLHFFCSKPNKKFLKNTKINFLSKIKFTFLRSNKFSNYFYDYKKKSITIYQSKPRAQSL